MRRTRQPLIATLTFGLFGMLLSATLLADLPWGPPAAGEQGRLTGVVTAVGPGAFTLLNQWNREVRVAYDEETIFEELKRNFFRMPRAYSPADLGVGLELTVKGEGDRAGNLAAEWVKFTQDALRVSQSLQARVTPLEDGLADTRADIVQVRETVAATSRQMGAHVGDLRAGIRAVGEQSSLALDRADAALETGRLAHHRVGDIDDYRELGVLTVGFGFNSHELSDETRSALDNLAGDVGSESGYLLEISGFASSDGNDAYNRRLSRSRADEVIRYLVEHHQLPRQRILAPYGYGENNPLGDNSVLEGRRQNRRVEIRVLINMGIQPTREPAG